MGSKKGIYKNYSKEALKAAVFSVRRGQSIRDALNFFSTQKYHFRPNEPHTC